MRSLVCMFVAVVLWSLPTAVTARDLPPIDDPEEVVGPTYAPPQQPPVAACGDRSHVIAQLKEKFHEELTGFGLTGIGAIVELVSSESGSWTLMLSFPNGRSCLIATGKQWEMRKEKGKGV